MSIRLNPIVAAGTALVLALAVAVVAIPAEKAGAATLTACVNKKTGEMKMRFGNKAKKKCPKGFKKVTWNDSSTSPLSTVYGADGTRAGKFLGAGLLSGFPIYAVLRNGGQYFYSAGTGEMLDILGSPSFTDATCSGTAYAATTGSLSTTETNRYIKLLGGTFRSVFRTQSALGDFGAPLVWTGNGTSSTVAAVTLYELNDETGACEASPGGAFTGVLFGMRSVPTPTPYDFQGPLEIR